MKGDRIMICLLCYFLLVNSILSMKGDSILSKSYPRDFKTIPFYSYGNDDYDIVKNKELESKRLINLENELYDVLKEAIRIKKNPIFTTALIAGDNVILDVLAKTDLISRVPVIFIDTFTLFPETMLHLKEIENHYSFKSEIYHAVGCIDQKDYENQYGKDYWMKDIDKYDALCKVEPMNRALKEKDSDCWINGRRRDHGAERASLPIWEDKKLNPLAFWSFEDCWLYLRKNNVLYHPLHDIGYSSLGDSHSTDKVDLKIWFTYGGERSGRFKNLVNKDGTAKTECGIHIDPSKSDQRLSKEDKIILYEPVDDPNIINVNRLNFMENVVNNDQNVFLYAYSPYCKQCKAFEQEFKALSEQYKDDKNVRIARLNAYDEEILYSDLSLQIQSLGYPTLFLFKAFDKSNPIEYGDNDTRDSINLTKFIESLKIT